MKSELKYCGNCANFLIAGPNCPTCTNFSNWKFDELIRTSSNEGDLEHMRRGKKFDTDKVDWTLMPWKELEQVLMILEFGAKKYSRDNWKHVEASRYEKAAMRHLISYITGELNDPETGKSHLAHLPCNALFLMWNDNNRDDS